VKVTFPLNGLEMGWFCDAPLLSITVIDCPDNAPVTLNNVRVYVPGIVIVWVTPSTAPEFVAGNEPIIANTDAPPISIPLISISDATLTVIIHSKASVVVVVVVLVVVGGGVAVVVDVVLVVVVGIQSPLVVQLVPSEVIIPLPLPLKHPVPKYNTIEPLVPD
jgi:hypothetical protein